MNNLIYDGKEAVSCKPARKAHVNGKTQVQPFIEHPHSCIHYGRMEAYTKSASQDFYQI